MKFLLDSDKKEDIQGLYEINGSTFLPMSRDNDGLPCLYEINGSTFLPILTITQDGEIMSAWYGFEELVSLGFKMKTFEKLGIKLKTVLIEGENEA